MRECYPCVGMGAPFSIGLMGGRTHIHTLVSNSLGGVKSSMYFGIREGKEFPGTE